MLLGKKKRVRQNQPCDGEYSPAQKVTHILVAYFGMLTANMMTRAKLEHSASKP